MLQDINFKKIFNDMSKNKNKKNKKNKEINYTETVIKIFYKINSNSIICRYDIKTKNGTSKTGSFNLIWLLKHIITL